MNRLLAVILALCICGCVRQYPMGQKLRLVDEPEIGESLVQISNAIANGGGFSEEANRLAARFGKQSEYEWEITSTGDDFVLATVPQGQQNSLRIIGNMEFVVCYEGGPGRGHAQEDSTNSSD